ncbi:MAG: hypothetical protein MUP98_15630 [Candidatus Aminicenantes bacterium]|nr:hypothetical protein [Candidatus Aminicenantes bacterium]
MQPEKLPEPSQLTGIIKSKEPQEEKKTDLLSLFSEMLWKQSKLWKKIKKDIHELDTVPPPLIKRVFQAYDSSQTALD